MSFQACTIVAKNYLGQARVLARSFREHHPDGRFCVVVVDSRPGDDPLEEPFEIISPFDIGLDADEFLRMATMYDVTELSTALKPWALRTLLDRGGTATYLDPDILVLRPLDELGELADRHQIVLTPHITKPMPRDGRMPDEEIIMLSGTYNLGYISVGQGGRAFLDWWSERMSRWAIIDPGRGLFTDQRWIDFVPSLFEHTVMRDPGYNAAYWNLYERPVGRGPDGFTVRGVPLRFFHYSGYDTALPYLLSKHQGDRPRVLLSESAPLRELCEVVRGLLVEAGHERTKHNPYGFARTAAGVSLTASLRRTYREAVLQAERIGQAVPPHAFGEPSEFLGWLNEPVVGPIDSPVSRYLDLLYSSRPDLAQAFPDLNGDSAGHLRNWARTDETIARTVPPELIPASDPEPVLTARPPMPGFNVVGYFEAELGVGEAGRLAAGAVESAGLPVSTFTYKVTTSRQRAVFRGRGPGNCPYDINLLCVNADQTPRLAQALGSEFLRHRYNIGMWFWELEQFPAEFHGAFALLDEIWAPSPFIAEALRPIAGQPVLEFPLPVLRPSIPTALTRQDLGIPSGVVFLFAFDFLSVFDRKNPLGLIEAYTRAFGPEDGVSLVIKSVNGDQRIRDREALHFATAARPDIHVWDRYLTTSEIHALTQLTDCYVSLHRSEGFGLTMAHAMAWGKPTIATAYSGNLAFMTPDNSFLVPYELTEVGSSAPPYPPTALWAEPDLDIAASLMRAVVDDPERAAAIGSAGARDIAAHRSASVAGAFVRAQFDRLHQR